ncbi:hypothetical protein JKL49_06590 [Phenylobacterium sp. 20VBR1]|uniref:Chemotaxis protein CheE n=1 Tax=Phenylobacterium glaciei TaxID=2803784 RepID=A0A941HVT4_9CAUL|nr:hypothetical protein [Phenylobacterium glaciei]MBR7619053.1 hypothetical protein [Phenylobacterium glaciei]QQZ51390.1 hypothetical protein JKL49_10395 [Phenylobacterium glaciei]
MSVVRKFHVTTNLSKLIKAPGGMYVPEALKRGEAAVEASRETSLAEVDEALAAMEALVAAPDFDPEAVYNQSARLITFCGACSDDSLLTAARSLCELVDRAGEAGRRDDRGVKVHLASLRLLHRSEADEETRKAILAGLAQVVDRYERDAQA